MSVESIELPIVSQRPKRADAQRNYDKLLVAAREAFRETDTETSLEDIARRAGVGIGTLYRHFPTRRVLIEAVYVEEVDALARSARDVAELEPWDALSAWLRHFVEYVATKQALANELFADGTSSNVFVGCRSALLAAGEPLLERAQEVGLVRKDVNISDVLLLVGGIAKVVAPDPNQAERIFDVALAGLRYQA